MKSTIGTHFKHKSIFYIPCFQKNKIYEGADGQLHVTSAFEYRMEDATTDEQMAASMNPDYIFVVEGEFDAKTQPFDLETYKHNNRIPEKKNES